MLKGNYCYKGNYSREIFFWKTIIVLKRSLNSTKLLKVTSFDWTDQKWVNSFGWTDQKWLDWTDQKWVNSITSWFLSLFANESGLNTIFMIHTTSIDLQALRTCYLPIEETWLRQHSTRRSGNSLVVFPAKFLEPYISDSQKNRLQLLMFPLNVKIFKSDSRVHDFYMIFLIFIWNDFSHLELLELG